LVGVLGVPASLVSRWKNSTKSSFDNELTNESTLRSKNIDELSLMATSSAVFLRDNDEKTQMIAKESKQ
jgi:hypothetical protein